MIPAGGPPADGGGRWSGLEIGLLAAAMLLVVLLVGPQLGRASFWGDEVFSLTTAHDWAGMCRTFTTYENNMALYYVLLHMWMALVGDGEAAVRSLSLIFALATLPVVHALARRLFDVRTAICADFLLAVSTHFLGWAQEARSYSLLILLSALSVWMFVEAIRRPRWSAWLAFSVFSALSIYAHYFGILTIAACFAASLWLGITALPWRRMLVATAAIGVLLIPLAVLHPPNASQIDWIDKPGIRNLSYCVSYFANDTKLLAVVLLACAVLGFMRRRQDGGVAGPRARSWPFVQLVAWLALPVVAAFAASWLIKPVFMPKYLIGSLPALLILAAAGIATLPTRWATLLVAALVLPFVWRYVVSGRQPDEYEDWRDAVAKVVASAQPGDMTIVYPAYSARPFNFYLQKWPGAPADLAPQEIASGPYHPGGGSAVPPADLDLLKRLIASHPRVWLVDCTSRPGMDHQGIVNALAAGYRTTSTVTFPHVQAILYAEPSR